MKIHSIWLIICLQYSKCFDLIIHEYDYLIIFLWHRVEHATTLSKRSHEVTYGSSWARVACGARRNRDKGDDDNHQELVMGGRALPVVLGGVEFM